MSYILDALRRADAERERGEVPSLHSQQYGALPGDDERAERPLLLIGAVVFLVLALGAALAWNFRGGSDTTSRGAAQGNVAPLPAPAPLPSPASLPALAAQPPPAAAPASTPPPVTTSVLPTTSAAAEEKHRRATAAAKAAAPERRRVTRKEAPSLPAPEPGSAPGKLPEALRRELPNLAFGGASYSKDAASRMVIFNGRVFHEGDTIAPQLVLERIKLKAAILTYKGYRYEIAF